MHETQPSGEPAPKVQPAHDGSLDAEVIVVGSDLLSGQVGDSSAQLVCGALDTRGAIVRRVAVVPDENDAIEAALRDALQRNPHIVVTIGGLGPAVDDRTYAAVAQVLGLPLKMNPGARSVVEAGYRRMVEERRAEKGGIDAAREKLACLPVGCVVLDNPVGVAPGAIYRLPGGTAVINVPGTPREARLVLDGAFPHLQDLSHGRRVARRQIEAPVADESALRPLLEKVAEEYPNARLTTRPVGSAKKGFRVVIAVETQAESTESAESAIGLVVNRLLGLVSGAK